MRILIAEDDPVSRRVLEVCLLKWGHEVVVTSDGFQACEALLREGAPRLAILDWMMPGMDGTEVCRRVRGSPVGGPAYLILLTAKGRKEDIVVGLGAGADDYVTKPFDHEELRARVQVGLRVATLQNVLADRVKELEESAAKVR